MVAPSSDKDLDLERRRRTRLFQDGGLERQGFALLDFAWELELGFALLDFSEELEQLGFALLDFAAELERLDFALLDHMLRRGAKQHGAVGFELAEKKG